MDNEDATQPDEIAVNRMPLSLEEKLRLIHEMRGCTAGGPSGCDMLLEDRRRERELEMAKDGW